MEGEREYNQRPDPRLVHCGHLELNPVPPEWFPRPLMTSTLAYTPILPNTNLSIHGKPATLAAYVLFLLGNYVPSLPSIWNISPGLFLDLSSFSQVVAPMLPVPEGFLKCPQKLKWAHYHPQLHSLKALIIFAMLMTI